MVPYILQHWRFPDCKKYSWSTMGSLLDNKAVVAGVRRHLAEQRLGKVTPQGLKKYVNDTLLPQLCPEAAPNKKSISESSAKQWCWKFGYCCVESCKGTYIDGHECEDVIKYCKEYLQTFPCQHGFGRLMQQYGSCSICILEHIPIFQDESTFHTNEY